MISLNWRKYISDIKTSLSDQPNNSKFREHYIGVIDDDNTTEYNKMMKLFQQLKDEEVKQRTNLRNLNTNIDLHMQYIGSSSSPSFSDIRKSSGDIYNDNLTLDSINKAKQKLHTDKLKNLEEKKKYNNKITTDFNVLKSAFKNPFNIKKELKAMVDIPISISKRELDTYKQDTEYNTESPQITALYEYFLKRKTLNNYFKDHFTYVFIGKDKSNIQIKTGDKDICKKYCVKNCIYNTGENNKPFSNLSNRYVTDKTINKILKNFSNFPELKKSYLNKIGADPSYYGTVGDLEPEFCKCSTQTSINGKKSKWYNGCYSESSSDMFNKNANCGPVDNFITQETFSGNIIEGMNVYNENDEWNTVNNKIDEISELNNKFIFNKKKIESGEVGFVNLMKRQHDYSTNKGKLNTNDLLYNQMYEDNLLISKRQTIIRYLIIIILVFSILIILKYINIV